MLKENIPNINEIKVGACWLKPNECVFRFYGSEIDLSPSETNLLKLLMNDPGVWYTRDDILNALNVDLEISDRYIDSLVQSIRKKISIIHKGGWGL